MHKLLWLSSAIQKTMTCLCRALRVEQAFSRSAGKLTARDIPVGTLLGVIDKTLGPDRSPELWHL